MDPISYKPTDKFYDIAIKNVVWGIIGIAFGVIVNNASSFLSTNILYIDIVLQLSLVSIAVTFVYFYVNNYFGWSWQNTIP